MRKKLKQLLVIIMTACILFTSMSWDGLAIDAAEVATIQQPSSEITENNPEAFIAPEDVYCYQDASV